MTNPRHGLSYQEWKKELNDELEKSITYPNDSPGNQINKLYSELLIKLIEKDKDCSELLTTLSVDQTFKNNFKNAVDNLRLEQVLSKTVDETISTEPYQTFKKTLLPHLFSNTKATFFELKDDYIDKKIKLIKEIDKELKNLEKDENIDKTLFAHKSHVLEALAAYVGKPCINDMEKQNALNDLNEVIKKNNRYNEKRGIGASSTEKLYKEALKYKRKEEFIQVDNKQMTPKK